MASESAQRKCFERGFTASDTAMAERLMLWVEQLEARLRAVTAVLETLVAADVVGQGYSETVERVLRRANQALNQD